MPYQGLRYDNENDLPLKLLIWQEDEVLNTRVELRAKYKKNKITSLPAFLRAGHTFYFSINKN